MIIRGTNFVNTVISENLSNISFIDKLQDTQTFFSWQEKESDNPVIETVREALMGIITDWLADHPRIAWIIANPLLALVLGLVILILFWGFIRMIFRLSERLWILIFQAPIKLFQLIYHYISLSFKQFSIPLYQRQQERDQRLNDILVRLELLREEQETLLIELKDLVR